MAGSTALDTIDESIKTTDDSHSNVGDVSRDAAPGLLDEVWAAISPHLPQLDYHRAKASTNWFFDRASYSVSVDDIMMVMTLFVLFGDNIKLLAASIELDDGFQIANSICMFFFIIEFLANTWTKTKFITFYPFVYNGYLFSFFWYLDIVSIVSMWFDISWIADPMGMGDIASQVGGNSNLMKAGRVARLVRLVRLVRLYKIAMEKRQKLKADREIKLLIERGDLTYDEVQKQRMLNEKRQSKLGEQLSNIITQKVIIVVLILVIIIPLLQPDDQNGAPLFGTKFMQNINTATWMDSGLRTSLIKEFVNQMTYDGISYAASQPDIVYLHMSQISSTPLIDKSARLNYIRKSAKIEYFWPKNCDTSCPSYTHAIYDYNPVLRESAMYSIVITIFIGFMLVVGSVTFNEDSQKLVLTPIERMMNMVEAVARDPMQELHFDETDDTSKIQGGDYETKLLESTIEKITSLLRVGFGEAGAGIISTNLSQNSGNAAVDPLLPGIRVYIIVGFCDIHHFEEILVKLSDGILTFVNTIASIVHESVCQWDGQCNKNLGNAFVILWRISDENSLLNLIKTSSFRKKSGDAGGDQIYKKQLIDLRRVPGIDTLADHALIGYLKIIAEINRNKDILAYRSEPRLVTTVGEEFKVRMGFGLHAGWAIEGAVGSIYKVDATYLSPHVNMAARLETSSRQYGVPLLASHFVHELMSETAQSRCRRVDIVTVKGSEVPISIYTYDALQDQVFKRDATLADTDVKHSKFTSTVHSQKHEIMINLQNVIPIDVDDAPGAFSHQEISSSQGHGIFGSRDGVSLTGGSTELDDDHVQEMSPSNSGSGSGVSFATSTMEGPIGLFLTNSDDTADVFDKDDDLLMLRSHITPIFLDIFKSGVDHYLDGKWDLARDLLQQSNEMMKELAPSLGGDGPSITLLNYMEERNWTKPSDWEGFRPLTSK